MSSAPRPPASFASRARGAPTTLLATGLVVLLALAGVVTTGVRLGTTLAPASDDPAETTDPAPDGVEGPGGPGRPGSTTPTEGGPSSLPDRLEGDRSATSTTPPPGSTDPTDPTAPAPPDEGPAPRQPYPGVWPYASWDEVRGHLARGDRSFSSAAGTALRFAREVVGLASPAATVRAATPELATVAVSTTGGTTLVRLVRVGPDGVTDGAPWGVVSAEGAVALSAPPVVEGPSTAVTVAGGGTPTVAVFDGGTWRGVVGAVEGGSAVVRVTRGPAGPAVVLAIEGDPRRPASFTARRTELVEGAGAAPAPAPPDPLDAVAALLDAVGAGDVPEVWELLDGPARREVLDWRGLAGRLPDLRRALAPFAEGRVGVTTLATPAGSVAVVVPRVTGDQSFVGGPGALALRLDAGSARLSSLSPAEAEWAPAPEGGLLVTGAPRATAVVVDGTVVATEPTGAGLRAPLDGVAPGPHLAVAVFTADDRVLTSTHLFVADEPAIEPPPPPTPGPRSQQG